MSKHMTEAKARRLIDAIEAIRETEEWDEIECAGFEDVRAAVSEWA